MNLRDDQRQLVLTPWCSPDAWPFATTRSDRVLGQIFFPRNKRLPKRGFPDVGRDHSDHPVTRCLAKGAVREGRHAYRRFPHVPLGSWFGSEITPATQNAPTEVRRWSPNIQPLIMTPYAATLPVHDARRTGMRGPWSHGLVKLVRTVLATAAAASGLEQGG